MNYRHIYHAGNFADVIKHIVLVMVLEYLKKKDKPMFVLDTHGGIGLYDLESEQAQKTREGEDGIGRLWGRDDIPEPVVPYMDIVRKVNNAGDLRRYPGSPLIIKYALRANDRYVINELHPEDYETLCPYLIQDARARVERDDGYTQLEAKLPPHERRGLVLLDPPFEVENEFDLMVEGLAAAHKRWPVGGVYMFWYPIKDPRDIRNFHSRLRGMSIPKITAVDFYKQKPNDPELFNGTGLILVNAPFTLADDLRAIMPWLTDVLTDGRGSFEVKTLTAE